MNNEILEDLECYEFNIDEQYVNVRIDKFLSLMMTNMSRNYIQEFIEDGYVFVNEKNVKSSYKLLENDHIIVYLKPLKEDEILPENIPLNIVYEDSDIAIINKEAGMVVHPSAGHSSCTLVNALLYHIKDLSGINGVYRPGIVHRIDKDTSGLIAIAKNDIAHNSLANQLKDHTMSRNYLCLVKGVLESKRGMIKTLINRDKKNRLKMAVVNDNGKEAITEFEVVQTFNDKYSLVKCHLQTGRTHQIRVHMNFIKHPIINDPLYGENNKISLDCAQLLHAYELTLIHPTTHEKMTFNAPLPSHFNKAIEIVSANKK
ncbi:MAG: RluA family pseudouridine synthase [Erysipelotrichaceae bacterium]|nr:RluA family pseudouridine synthase [Erysipelotrichaceae bacterium]